MENDRLDHLLAEVNQGGLRGYIDSKGEVVIPIIHHDVKALDNGLILASTHASSKLEQPLFGAYNKSGQVIIPFIYESLYAASRGLLAACYQGKWGFLTSNGQKALEFKYSLVSAFCTERSIAKTFSGEVYLINRAYEEIAMIADMENAECLSEGYIAIQGQRGWGIMNASGKLVLACEFVQIADAGALGFIIGVGAGRDILGEERVLYGLVDKNGQEILSPQFTSLGPVGDAQVFPFGVEVENGTSLPGEKKGLMDFSGSIILNPTYDYLSGFMGGVAIVGRLDQHHVVTFGAVDDKGEIQIPLSYTSLWSLPHNRFIASKGKIRTHGYLDIDPTTNEIKNRAEWPTYGVIDCSGEILIPFEYRNMIATSSKSFLVESAKYDKSGVISERNEVLIPFQKEELQHLGEEVFYSKKSNDRYHLVNLENRQLGELSAEIYKPVKYQNGWVSRWTDVIDSYKKWLARCLPTRVSIKRLLKPRI